MCVQSKLNYDLCFEWHLNANGGTRECRRLSKVKFCQKLGKSASEIFQVIKQLYSDEALDHSVCLSGTYVLCRGGSLQDSV